jgi:serine/threonine protein kinase
VIETIEKNIKAINTTGEPLSKIRDYAVMEVLGSGAFGTVYKVRKPSTDHYFLALKEVSKLCFSLSL